MDDILLKLGNNIRKLRTAKQLSLDDLAEKAGINDKYLGQVERGKHSISIKKLSQIAAALGIETFELLGTAHAHAYEIDRENIAQRLHKIIESASDEDLCAIYGFASDIVS